MIFNVKPSALSCILNQVLWFNRFIQFNNKPVFYKRFSSNNINFLIRLVERNDVFKDWNTLKQKYDLQKKIVFPKDATYKCHTI